MQAFCDTKMMFFLLLYMINQIEGLPLCPTSCNCNKVSAPNENFFISCPNGYNQSEMRTFLGNIPLIWNNPTLITFLNSSLSSIPEEACSIRKRYPSQYPYIELNGNDVSTLSKNSTLVCAELFSGLIIRYSNLQKVDSEYFRNFTSILLINLSHNKLSYIHPQTFTWPSLKKLIRLDLTYNNFITIDMWIFQLPAYMDGNRHVVVNMSFNQIEDMENTVGFDPTQVQRGHFLHVDLQYNRIHSLKRFLDVIRVKNLFDLWNFWDVTFHMKYNQLYCDCDMYYFMEMVRLFIAAFENTVAEELIMVPCYKPDRLAHKLIRHIKKEEFNCFVDNCTTDNCQCVYTPGNDTLRVICEGMSLRTLPEMVRTAKNLELYLSHNDIEHISKNKYFSNITILDLSNNSIVEISKDVIPPKVKYLLLHKNYISSLSQDIQDIDLSRLKQLTLSNNPFKCDCYAGWMKKWLIQNDVITDRNGVACSGPEWNYGKLVMEVNEGEFVCYKIGIIVKVVPVLVISIVLLLITILLIVFRDYVRLFLFTRFGVRLRYDYDDVTRKYDVFLSYNSQDEAWVDQLTENLETHEPAYRVCVHYKEFEPGLPIAQNIVNCIDASHCTVMVVSKNFLESDWCKYEFRVAHQSALIEKRTKVIVVVYGEVDSNKMDNDLRMYLKTNTYLKKDDPRFWNKLLMSLPKPSGRVNPADLDMEDYLKMNNITISLPSHSVDGKDVPKG